jgi:hypothetical protein
MSKTGLVPIIRDLNRWIADYSDPGLDPVDDDTAAIRIRALLVVDQLELLRALVQKQQLEKIDG